MKQSGLIMHKVMALDVGTKRIGIALSDYLQVIATPHSTIARQPEKQAIETIQTIAKENRVEQIVVGIPINMDDSLGFQAQDCKDFSQKLFGFDIIYEDENIIIFNVVFTANSPFLFLTSLKPLEEFNHIIRQRVCSVAGIGFG